MCINMSHCSYLWDIAAFLVQGHRWRCGSQAERCHLLFQQQNQHSQQLLILCCEALKGCRSPPTTTHKAARAFFSWSGQTQLMSNTFTFNYYQVTACSPVSALIQKHARGTNRELVRQRVSVNTKGCRLSTWSCDKVVTCISNQFPRDLSQGHNIKT